MFEDLNKSQKIFMVILYLLTLVATVMGAFAIYNISTVKKPWTLGVTYADALNTQEGQKQIISVEIHSNENNNGVPVYDMKFNSYADTEGNGLRGFGIQCVGDWKIVNKSDYEVFSTTFDTVGLLKDAERFKVKKEQIEEYKNQYANMFESNQTIAFGDFYFYYTGDDGKVYSKIEMDKFDDELLIDIDGSYYKLSLKSYEYEVLSNNAWDLIIGNVAETKTSNFTWFEIFDLVMSAAIENSGKVKYDEFPLALMDLSNFVTLEYKADEQYKEIQKTTETRNYFTIQVNYNKDGLVESADSMFDMVYASSRYNYYAEANINDYWNAYTELCLTEKNVNFVYNTDLKKYYVTLDKEFSSYLETLDNAEISIVLDLRYLDIIVYGIDLQHFDFDIKDFTIKVDSIKDFKVYNQNLCGVEPTLKEV